MSGRTKKKKAAEIKLVLVEFIVNLNFVGEIWLLFNSVSGKVCPSRTRGPDVALSRTRALAWLD